MKRLRENDKMSNLIIYIVFYTALIGIGLYTEVVLKNVISIGLVVGGLVGLALTIIKIQFSFQIPIVLFVIAIWTLISLLSNYDINRKGQDKKHE